MGKDTCVIGHDNRLSSERIHNALTKGLIDSGINILDLELETINKVIEEIDKEEEDK